MARYRRLFVPGGTYFFTVCLARRGDDLLVREVAALREAVRATRAERPFGIGAWVRCGPGEAGQSVRWTL